MYSENNGENEYGYSPEPEKEDSKTDKAYGILTEKGKPKKIGWSVASLVCGIISLSLAFFGWPALVLGVLAVVFSLVSRITLGYFNGFALAGLMIGIFGFVFGITVIIVSATAPEIIDNLGGIFKGKK